MHRAFFALLIWLLAVSSKLSAQTVTASWAPNTEDDLAGYLLYYGTKSGRYDQVFQTTNTSFTVDGLAVGQTYHFVVKAFDYSSNISGPSEEVNITVQPASGTDYDFNNDGIVDPDDAPSIRLHYGRIVDDLNGLYMYDLNNDGIIDPEDVEVLRTHYGELQ